MEENVVKQEDEKMFLRFQEFLLYSIGNACQKPIDTPPDFSDLWLWLENHPEITQSFNDSVRSSNEEVIDEIRKRIGPPRLLPRTGEYFSVKST